MDKLQKQFDGKIQIISYTSEKHAVVQDLFKRIKKQMNMILPSASEMRMPDIFKAGGKYWIYKGKLIAITSKYEVNEESIRSVLNGGDVIYKGIYAKHMKKFKDNDFSESKLKGTVLMKNDYGKFKTVLTKGIKGYDREGVRFDPKKNPKSYGIRYINFTKALLFSRAYGMSYYGDWSIEVADKEAYFPKHGSFTTSNTYCYEVLTSKDENADPNALYKEILEIMKKDLEKAFNITVTKEKRKVKVYVLRKTKGYKKLISKGGEMKGAKTAFFINYENVPFSSVVKAIKYFLSNRRISHIIDETNLNDTRVDIDINARTFKYKEMKKALKKYGLKLTIEEREREMFVIKNL